MESDPEIAAASLSGSDTSPDSQRTTLKRENGRTSPVLGDKTPTPNNSDLSRLALAAVTPVTLNYHENIESQTRALCKTAPNGCQKQVLAEVFESANRRNCSMEEPAVWKPLPPVPALVKSKGNTSSRAYWPRWHESCVFPVSSVAFERPRLSTGLALPVPAHNTQSPPAVPQDFLSSLLPTYISEGEQKDSSSARVDEHLIKAVVVPPAYHGRATAPASLGKSCSTSRSSSPASGCSKGVSPASATQKPLKVRVDISSQLPVVKPFQPPPLSSSSGLSSKASTASSASEDGCAAQAGSAVDFLRDVFSSSAAWVTDVYEACGGNFEEAFDKLQQMQSDAEDAAFGWEKSWGQHGEEVPVGRKIETLSKQYSLPRGVIEEFLKQNDFDIDKASCELLIYKEEEDKLATDRALAEEVNNALATGFHNYNPALRGIEHDVPGPARHDHMASDRALAEELSQQQLSISNAPHEQRIQQEGTSREDVLENLSPEERRKFSHLCACFPSTPPQVVCASLEVSVGDFELAKEVLREDGQDEDVRGFENRAESSSQAAASHCSLYRRLYRNSLEPTPSTSHQDIYREHRARAYQLKREIGILSEERERLKAEGRHNDASLLDIEIQCLVRESRAADDSAGAKIFDAMNKRNCAQRTVDLHGLHVNEALAVTDELVSQFVNDRFNDNWCELITGCGNHSVDNIPKVQRAVLAYLKQRGIFPVVHPGNKGVVCFRITRGMRLQPCDRSGLRIPS